MDRILERIARAMHQSFYVGKMPESEAWTSYSTLHKSGFFDSARAVIDAHIAGLAEEGFMVVPREPTAAMKQAGEILISEMGSNMIFARTSDIYRAMTEASE